MSGDVFHVYRGVRKPVGRDRGSLCDELAAHHIFRRGIDGFDGGDLAVPQMEHGEFARGRLPAQDPAPQVPTSFEISTSRTEPQIVPIADALQTVRDRTT